MLAPLVKTGVVHVRVPHAAARIHLSCGVCATTTVPDAEKRARPAHLLSPFLIQSRGIHALARTHGTHAGLGSGTSSSSFFFLRLSSSLAVGARTDDVMDPNSEASPPPAPGPAAGAAAILAGEGCAASPVDPPPGPPLCAALLAAASAGVAQA